MTTPYQHYKQANMEKHGPKVVVVAVTDKEGRVLIVRRSACETNRAKEWETPGGHRDKGETVEQAAIREVKEETGYDIVVIPGSVSFELRDHASFGVMVRGLLKGGDGRLKLDEHDMAVWVHPKEVGRFRPCPPLFADNVRRVLAMSGPHVKKQADLNQVLDHVTNPDVLDYLHLAVPHTARVIRGKAADGLHALGNIAQQRLGPDHAMTTNLRSMKEKLLPQIPPLRSAPSMRPRFSLPRIGALARL